VAKSVCMTNTVRVVSWNLHRYLQHAARRINLDEVTGWVATVITRLDADVVLLQGLPSETDAGHGLGLLTELADATRSNCDTTANSASPHAAVVAIAQSSAGCGSGILWDPGLTPVPSSWSSYGHTPAGLCHSMAVLTLAGDFGDLRVASFLAEPTDPSSRVDDAQVVRDALAQNTDIPTLIGGGWNSLSADCDADADLYTNTGANSTLMWRKHFEQQVRITTFKDGAPASWKVDRRPTTGADPGR
jgi:endonuclease/exonuclease/phosphatase family metal-dependent hydrolase